MPIRNHDNKFRRPFHSHLVMLFIGITLIAFLATSTSAEQPVPNSQDAANDYTVWLDGPNQATAGELLTYNIATDAAGLFGVELDLAFDPAFLQAVGTVVSPGSCPAPDFVVTNNMDNGAGTISYAATALAPTPPCDGGIIASFQFQVSPTAAAGSTAVQFGHLIFADVNGSQIPATTVDLNLEIIVTTVNAAFSGTPLAGPAPLTVNFMNLSSGDYNTCSWTFGDGTGSSSCLNQSHTFTTPGAYTVSLAISGPSSSDSETKPAYISVWEQSLLYLPVIIR